MGLVFNAITSILISSTLIHIYTFHVDVSQNHNSFSFQCYLLKVANITLIFWAMKMNAIKTPQVLCVWSGALGNSMMQLGYIYTWQYLLSVLVGFSKTYDKRKVKGKL